MRDERQEKERALSLLPRRPLRQRFPLRRHERGREAQLDLLAEGGVPADEELGQVVPQGLEGRVERVFGGGEAAEGVTGVLVWFV